MKPEDFPQFIKNNRKYIEEAYMTKQPIKSPLTEYCLSKLKEQGQIPQHTTMETLFPPKSHLRRGNKVQTQLMNKCNPLVAFYNRLQLPVFGSYTKTLIKPECKIPEEQKQNAGDLSLKQKMILSGIIKVNSINNK